jgi:hypothetical protein
MGVMLAHTHLGDAALQEFSTIDDHGESLLQPYFNSRMPDQHHFSALFTKTRSRCRKLGTQHFADVELIGREVRILSAESNSAQPMSTQYSRQAIAFGPAIQSKLARLKVAIVGLGGTGSVIATELAHLGVLNYVLIDPDIVDESNLNRLI